MNPLSFAALAASGPLWEKDVKPGERRCRSCLKSKKVELFNGTSTLCQICGAKNKLRKTRAQKDETQKRLRVELRERVRNASNKV